jgi:hypothetical protein
LIRSNTSHLVYVLDTPWYVSNTSLIHPDTSLVCPGTSLIRPIHLGHDLISFFYIHFEEIFIAGLFPFYNRRQRYKFISNSSKHFYHNNKLFFIYYIKIYFIIIYNYIHILYFWLFLYHHIRIRISQLSILFNSKFWKETPFLSATNFYYLRLGVIIFWIHVRC